MHTYFYMNITSLFPLLYAVWRIWQTLNTEITINKYSQLSIGINSISLEKRFIICSKIMQIHNGILKLVAK